MLFTNDLDRMRDQDFKKVHRELYELILDSGFQWTDEAKFFLRIVNSKALRSSIGFSICTKMTTTDILALKHMYDLQTVLLSPVS